MSALSNSEYRSEAEFQVIFYFSVKQKYLGLRRKKCEVDGPHFLFFIDWRIFVLWEFFFVLVLPKSLCFPRRFWYSEYFSLLNLKHIWEGLNKFISCRSPEFSSPKLSEKKSIVCTLSATWTFICYFSWVHPLHYLI